MFRINNTDGHQVSIYEIYEKEYSYSIKNQFGGEKKLFKNPIVQDYEKLMKSATKESCCIQTGIDSLNKALGGGFRPGLYVFGANPGIGKTSLMLHLMVSLAILKQHSILFNLEMSESQILARLLANLSYRMKDKVKVEFEPMTINDFLSKSVAYGDGKWNPNILNTGKVYNEQFHEFITILTKAHDSKLTYVETIETTIKNCKELLGITPVIMIDFLQLLQNSPQYKDETDPIMKLYDKRLDVNEIIEKLKEYSNLYQVPIIIITSISRSSYTKDSNGDNDTEYNMSFAKESGNIEYMADFLALLTREKTTTKFGESDHQSIVINILKSRTSSSYEKVYLDFIPEYAYFSEPKDGEQL